jgi:hypothetical protein
MCLLGRVNILPKVNPTGTSGLFVEEKRLVDEVGVSLPCGNAGPGIWLQIGEMLVRRIRPTNA